MEDYLYEKLISSCIKRPGEMPSNPHSFAIYMNNLISNDQEESRRGEYGMLVCRMFDELIVKYLKTSYNEAVSTNNQILAEKYHHSLMDCINHPMFFKNNKDNNLVQSFISQSKPKKRFTFVEHLMKEGMYGGPFENNSFSPLLQSRAEVQFHNQNPTCDTSSITHETSEATDSRSKQSLSSFRNTNSNHLDLTIQNKSNLNSKLQSGNFPINIHRDERSELSSIINPSTSKHNAIIHEIPHSKLDQSKRSYSNVGKCAIKTSNNVRNQSKSDLKIKETSRGNSKPVNDVNSVYLGIEKVPKKETYSSKLSREKSRQTNSSKFPKKSLDVICVKNHKTNKPVYEHMKKNNSAAKKSIESNLKQSVSFSTPVSHVSKVSAQVLNTIDINKRKKRKLNDHRESSRGNSTLRSIRKKRRIEKTPSNDNHFNSDIKLTRSRANRSINSNRYASADYSNNLSDDGSVYSHVSTPTSSFFNRGSKTRTLYRRNLFSAQKWRRSSVK